MDLALQRGATKSQTGWRWMVSILVVMDLALQPLANVKCYLHDRQVSILVVMDLALQQAAAKIAAHDAKVFQSLL